MTGDVPPTFDRLMLDVQAHVRDLIGSLHRLEEHVDKHSGQAQEADRESVKKVSLRLWQAVGMAEGVLHMVELADKHRPRSLV